MLKNFNKLYESIINEEKIYSQEEMMKVFIPVLKKCG